MSEADPKDANPILREDLLREFDKAVNPRYIVEGVMSCSAPPYMSLTDSSIAHSG